MRAIKIILVTYFLLFFLDFFSYPDVVGMGTPTHITLLVLCAVSAIVFAFVSRFSPSSIPLYLLAFVFPIVAAFQSKMIFGQSIFLGLASLRYQLEVCFIMFLLLIKYPYRTMVRQVNIINVSIAVLSIIAFFFLNVDDLLIQPLMDTGNVLGEELDEMAFKTKGRFLTVHSTLMIFSYIYYLVSLMRRFSWKNLIFFSILMAYLLFVHKGRQPLICLAGVFMMYYVRMNRLTGKKILFTLIPVLLVVALLVIAPSFINRFLDVLQGENSADFSTETRTTTILAMLPYLKKFFLLGVGNLSAHFHNSGFQFFMGEKFYVQDAGIIGVLFVGGLFLLAIYVQFYLVIRRNLFKVPLEPGMRLYMLFLVDYYIIQLFVLREPLLLDNCFSFALMYYPLFAFKRKVTAYA